MKLSNLSTVLAGALIFSLSLSTNAALHPRDLDGDLENGHEGVYDDVLDITWLADANLALSVNFGVSYASLGRMTTAEMELYLLSANVAQYLGHNSWRAPKTEFLTGTYNITNTYDGSSDRGYNLGASQSLMNPNPQSPNFIGSEMAYMYYQNFGALARCASSALCLGDPQLYGLNNVENADNLNLFSNINITFPYRSGTVTGPGDKAIFFFAEGEQNKISDGGSLPVWLVHDGDLGDAVGPNPEDEVNVPIPPFAIAAIGGLLVLISARVRSKQS